MFIGSGPLAWGVFICPSYRPHRSVRRCWGGLRPPSSGYTSRGGGRSTQCHHRAGSIGRHGPRETRCFHTDILNMEIGRELLFHRGQKPLNIKRYDLFHDPLYAECQQMGKGPQTIVDDSGDMNLSLW